MKNKTSSKTQPAKSNTLAFILMAIFFCELFAYTWCRVQCTGVGYEISQAVKERKQLAVEQKQLQVELARLKSPKSLANIAETYDLKMPSSRQRVVIK